MTMWLQRINMGIVQFMLFQFQLSLSQYTLITNNPQDKRTMIKFMPNLLLPLRNKSSTFLTSFNKNLWQMRYQPKFSSYNNPSNRRNYEQGPGSRRNGRQGREEETRQKIEKIVISQEELVIENYVSGSKTLESLKKKGIQEFFPIQAKTFELVSEGKDLIACDRTGSGKTIAFSLPTIEKLRKEGAFDKDSTLKKAHAKFVILAPTRELALQITAEIQSLKHSPNDFTVITLYGGAPRFDQSRGLQKGADIIVATPGRMIDFYNSGNINFSQVQTLCLDEADYMLEIGFKNDVDFIMERIFSATSSKPQVLLFSATMPEWVKSISRKFMDPNCPHIQMFTPEEKRTSVTVRHHLVSIAPENRILAIWRLIKKFSKEGRVLIFTNTKMEANMISTTLKLKNTVLHSQFDQNARTHRLNKFKSGNVKILIATDVASRGLDIPNVELVIQISPPNKSEAYIHRSGRTGRAGNEGVCCTIINQFINTQYSEMQKLKKATNTKISQFVITKQEFEEIEREMDDYEPPRFQRTDFESEEPDYDGFKVFFESIPEEMDQQQIYRELRKKNININERNIFIFSSKTGRKHAVINPHSEEIMNQILKLESFGVQGSDKKARIKRKNLMKR